MSFSNRFYLDARQSRQLATELPIYPALGFLSAIVSTLVAISLIPEDPFPAGALLLPALSLSIALAAAPIASCIKTPRAILRTENLLVITPIFWLLLDLLQSAYPRTEVSRPGIEGAFIAIGIFVCGVWVAALTRPLRLPSFVARASSLTVRPKILFLLIIVFFALGMIRFAYPANFNLIEMANALTQGRWDAPWTRGQLGGWDAFLDHMAYFGYLLPVLTVLLARYSKSINGRVITSVILSLIMTAFLAQGGGRRIVGVIWGAAIICWALQQPKI